MNIDDKITDKIIEVLKENIKPWIIYIFGSAANGVFREDSDIDIAFLSDAEISDYQVFMISQKLADILKREVDLINLKKSSDVFKVQVIAKGERIHCVDDKRRAYFEMYAFKDYALLNEERKVILDNIKNRGSIYD